MRGYVDINGGQIHYRRVRSGGASRTIVLLHESPLSSATFAGVLDDLAELDLELDVVAFDLPGYGMSDPPSEPPSVRNYARWLLAAMDGLGIGRFTAFGSHGGSLIGMELALQSPERVEKLVLSGIPIMPAEELEDFRTNIWTLHTVEPDIDGRHLAEVWNHYRKWWGEEAGPDLLHLAVTTVLSNHKRYMAMLDATLDYDGKAALMRLEVPVVLFTAQRDPVAHGAERALELRPDIVTKVDGPDVGGQLWWRARRDFVTMVANVANERRATSATGARGATGDAEASEKVP